MTTRRRQTFKSQLRESWVFGELSGLRDFLKSTKFVATVFFGTYKRESLITLALALVAFLFGWHKGGPGTQIIAFLVFLPVYAFVLYLMYIIWSDELMSKVSGAITTAVIGLLIWIGLDVLGYVILPSIALEQIAGIQPLGPLYRLVQAFTDLDLTEIGRPFWRGL